MVQIRPLHQTDFDEWSALWRGYLAFYQTVLNDDLYHTTFARLIDPARAHQNAFVAEADGRLIGLQRERGEAERVIRRQIEQGLEGLDAEKLVVAYEPIWAIGTGKTCAAEEANRICGLIRSWVCSPDLVIQYGGSVKPSNIDELMGMSDIDGVLVGGASLEPESFGRIANYQAA